MPKGTIKKLVRDRGFGFIACAERGGDIFFHVSSVQGTDFDNLEEGQSVEFDIAEGGGDRSKGPRAGQVRPL